jgi:hypothetical protein
VDINHRQVGHMRDARGLECLVTRLVPDPRFESRRFLHGRVDWEAGSMTLDFGTTMVPRALA